MNAISSTTEALTPERVSKLPSDSSSASTSDLNQKEQPSSSNDIYSIVSSTTKHVTCDDEDDSSVDLDDFTLRIEAPRSVRTKASVNESMVTSTTKGAPNYRGWSAEADRSSAVQQLLKLSHNGYGAVPFIPWNEARVKIERNVDEERGEANKRSTGEEGEQGRVKRPKPSNAGFKSNPGYNPVQVSDNYLILILF